MGRQVFIGHCPGLSDAVTLIGEAAFASLGEESRDLPWEAQPTNGFHSEDIREHLLQALCHRDQADPELLAFVDQLIASIDDQYLLEFLESRCLTSLSVDERGYYLAEVENFDESKQRPDW